MVRERLGTPAVEHSQQVEKLKRLEVVFRSDWRRNKGDRDTRSLCGASRTIWGYCWPWTISSLRAAAPATLNQRKSIMKMN